MPKPGVYPVTPQEIEALGGNGKWEDVRNVVEELMNAPAGTWMKVEAGADPEAKRKRLGTYAGRVNLYYMTRVNGEWLYVRKMEGPKFKDGRRI